jgi:hypothetical protein
MVNPDVRWLQRLDSSTKALSALTRGVHVTHQRQLSELEEQGLIQAFGFTNEQSLLLLKDFLADQGVNGISGSWDTVRESMIGSRNITSHTDNPELAHEIAGMIVRHYAPALEALQRRAEHR